MVEPAVKEVIVVPQGVTVTLTGSTLKVKGKNGELARDFAAPGITVSKEGNDVVLHGETPRKKIRALVGTYRAHINNMMKGAQENYEYKMKICFSHFPIKTKVQGEQFIIENFLGERTARKARIMPGTKVKVAGEEVILTGANVEHVSQTAANIEQATIIRGFDPRVFQDGIYITSKGA
ncbi:MAG: 50S ribosomal protein L6 [Candidatus Thermoplasmatota archaeon]